MIKRTTSAFVVLMFVAQLAIATIWYAVAGVGGAHNGSETDPFDTLTAGVAALQEGDTLRFSGAFREGGIVLSGVDNVTIERDAAAITGQLRGDRVVAPGNWTDELDGDFSATVALEPVGVVYNWDTSLTTPTPGTDEIARHYGHLPYHGSATADPDDGTWSWLAGTLHVDPPAGANDPDDAGASPNVWAYTVAGNGLTIDDCDGVTVDGLDVKLFIEYASALGYGVRIEQSTNCIYRNGRVDDCGWHMVGAVQDPQRGNVFFNLVLVGQNYDGVSGAAMVALHSSAIGAGNGDNLVANCDFHFSPLLGVDGNRLAGLDGFTGTPIIVHGAGANAIDNVLVTDCRVFVHPGVAGDVNLCNFNDGPAIADPEDYDDYPHRFVNTRYLLDPWHGGGVYGLGGEAAAFRRCRWELGDTAANTNITLNNQRLYIDATPIFFDNTAANGRLFNLIGAPSGTHLTLDLSTVRIENTNVNTGMLRWQSMASGAAVLHMTQTVVSKALSGRLGIDSTGGGVNIDELDIADCWFHNIGTTFLTTADATVDEKTDWQSTVDPNGVYDTDPQFVDGANGDLEPLAGGNLRTTTKVLAPFVPRIGVNLKPYDGHYGAYQFGQGGAGASSGLGSGLGYD